MLLNVRTLLLTTGATALVSSLTLPAAAQTPITDQFGATGTSPNAATWLESIIEEYGLANGTPITDQFGLPQESNLSVWVEALKSEYALQDYPTPVTDEFGATGSSPNAEAWRERIKEEYGIGV
ncbi:MAG: hypothetical protein IGS50_24110 [Synechococcales cyanobacterium C42_A2020_086]|jgi:hypothetical protein|nr:hypothetical protein [Synechococcales cyanobacterium C42_A2020_086]